MKLGKWVTETRTMEVDGFQMTQTHTYWKQTRFQLWVSMKMGWIEGWIEFADLTWVERMLGAKPRIYMSRVEIRNVPGAGIYESGPHKNPAAAWTRRLLWKFLPWTPGPFVL